MFTGVDLNAYEIRSPSPASRTGGSTRSCEAEGSRLAGAPGSDAGRPGLLVRSHLGDLPPRRAVGLEGAPQHLPGAVLRGGDAVPALSPLHPRRTGHGLLGEPEPAREARRRARRRAAQGEEARPVDRALEPGQRGGRRMQETRLGIAICASASRTSARSRRRTFGGSTTSSGSGVTRRPPPRPCGRRTRSAAGGSAGRNRGSAPPRRRARARPLRVPLARPSRVPTQTDGFGRGRPQALDSVI